MGRTGDEAEGGGLGETGEEGRGFGGLGGGEARGPLGGLVGGVLGCRAAAWGVHLDELGDLTGSVA